MTIPETHIEERDFVLTISNPSPVLITVPHDGAIPVPYLEDVFAKRVSDPQRDIRVTRDLRVLPIAKDILAHVPINLVYGLIARTYVDFNRPRDIAIADDRLGRTYDRYHAEMAGIVERCKSVYGKCLLLDLHGFNQDAHPGMEETDIILGVGPAKGPQSRASHMLAQFLEASGYRVILADDKTFNGMFSGRYNTLEYSERYACDAVLVEIGSAYRAKTTNEPGRKLSADLATYIREYIAS